jgi:hypothetical protein
MKYLVMLTAAAWIAAGAIEPATADDWESVNQSGNYTFTQVRQTGDRTKVKVRQIDPRKYERLRDRVAERFARINARYTAVSGFDGNGGQGGDSVTLDQSGNGNGAFVAQYGSRDSIAIDQTGSANAAYALQMGDNLQAAASQAGDHNITFIMQRDRGQVRQHLARFTPHRFRLGLLKSDP